jgi:hypothetical protein
MILGNIVYLKGLKCRANALKEERTDSGELLAFQK